MAKKTTKKKFSFSNMFKVTESQKQDIATGKFSGSKAPKNSAKDDFLMDIGVKERNQAYFRDLEDRQKRGREASNKLGKDLRGNPATDRSRPRGETAAERAARLKKEALEKRKTEGKERRKKFYKQKDERLAKLKAKLLNLA